ncbi:PepSY domain-containing protein [Streptomyces sp. NPDC057445]|uniref:PepSY domain-containing protein n=1 Tax=Streptomyces sp. NPDC057445 TaxID=3346136 RepID=UPI0036A571FB
MNESTHALRLRLALPACLFACSALLVTSCGSDEGTEVSAAAASPTRSPSPTGTETRLTDDQAERKALIPAAKVTWDQAAGTAVGEVTGSKLLEIDLTRYDSGSTASPAPSPGSPAWAAEVATQDGTVHRVLVDAESGTVLLSQPENDQDADDKREIADLLSKTQVTPEQAVKTATGKKQGTVTDVHLERDDDTLIWSVDVVSQEDWSKTNFDIDAANGEILREQVDQD